MSYKIFDYDPYLLPFETDINQRMKNYENKLKELVGEGGSLRDFANGHEYFGFHKSEDGWYYREWAPAADAVYLTGDMIGWNKLDLKLNRLENGVFEIFMPGKDFLYNGCHVKTIVCKDGRFLERTPLYIRRVEQDKDTGAWCGVITDEPVYVWKKKKFKPQKELLIYECHVGMAQEKEGIGSYREFVENVLPRIHALGYTAIQIMAIMEHPYYGSFGYQVSSFFASCSRYGTPNDLKYLIDSAHKLGIAVLLDVVHSHAVRNTVEGINEFDGTSYQFFHEGERGEHPAWGTKLFNYNKNEVIHFLLSNLKYWMDEFHFDGFRFDGVTSMIYHDHGLGTAFTDYGKYFSMNTDTEAITYLQLANKLIREINPNAITVAEDMSAMPGMCLPIEEGGIGFDYRLAMGLPDLWIKLIKTKRDEEWNMWQIWHELTSRRPGEKYVGYAESHDQALVGDKTIMFRLCDANMYTGMSTISAYDPVIERGIALHKMIRLLCVTLGGEGYLNFMGNEFGHPEWIDFPREGNNWSYFYCRRQWHLADDENLKYKFLNAFDGAMIDFTKAHKIFSAPCQALQIDEQKQVLVYERGGVVFAANFSPNNSYTGYGIKVPKGKYRVALTTDESVFGGYDRVSKDYVYISEERYGSHEFPIYLPARTALCLVRVKE